MDTFELKKYREIKDENHLYSSVLSHSKNPVTRESRSTNVHETSHIISSEIRNSHKGENNGFFIPNNKAVVIDQPSVKIKDVAKYVPPNLRGSRYKLYLVDQAKYWNDSPLYITEEWHCYTLGGSSAVADSKLQIKLEKTDAVAGTFEFMIYNTALFKCIIDTDKKYDILKFKEFYNWLFAFSFKTFSEGRTIPEYKSSSSDKLYNEFFDSKEGEDFRKFQNTVLDNRFEFDYL